MNRNFFVLLKALWAQNKFLCVGLDVDLSKLPSLITKEAGTIFQAMLIFNKAIIDATKDIVCAYKPNSAFYEQYGPQGMELLQRTIAYINHVAPEVPVILDYKRGDIDSTNIPYVKLAFEYYQADAVTVSPYLGREAMQPFLDQKDKGIIILCKTSNKKSGEFQDLEVTDGDPDNDEKGTQLFSRVAYNVSNYWNTNKNCLLVVGATYPEQLKEVRSIARDMSLLIPGYGAQNGDLEATLAAGFTEKGDGILINSSRGIIYVSNGEDFAEAARREALKVHNKIVVFKEKKFATM